MENFKCRYENRGYPREQLFSRQETFAACLGRKNTIVSQKKMWGMSKIVYKTFGKFGGNPYFCRMKLMRRIMGAVLSSSM